MERRYHALRTIATIYRVLGYIVLALTIIAVLIICGLSVIGGTALESASQQLGVSTGGGGLASSLVVGILSSLAVILYGGVIALSLIGIGEAIYLFLAIEENTRKTSLLLERQIPPPPPPLQT